MVKLIIWDLDGVLWSGSLTEGGDLNLHPNIKQFIIESEANGIIHSICSKNNFDFAKQKIQKENIWSLFVFPSINYTSKGPRIKSIIENCQLREQDVVFIDDNDINLNEAKYFCPNLTTYNNPFDFINTHQIQNGKSRTDQYKILETKVVEKQRYDSNDNFLTDSDIHIAIAERYDCLDFHNRIEELVNRSNQLNFTKSRFDSEAKPNRHSVYKNGKTYIQSSAHGYIMRSDIQSYGIFVWDKYGYYGLVGYISLEIQGDKLTDVAKITNCVFSCRIMNMNIEAKVIQYLLNIYPIILNIDERIEKTIKTDYITIHDYKDQKTFINSKEGIIDQHTIGIILANCIGPIYKTYSNYNTQLKTEIWYELEHTFHTDKLYHNLINIDDYPNLIIFAAYLEFVFDDLLPVYDWNITENKSNPSVYWNLTNDHTEEYFTKVIKHFIETVKTHNKKLLVLLPNKNEDFLSDTRYSSLYNAWSSVLNDPVVAHISMPVETNMDDRHPVNFRSLINIPGIRKYSRQTMFEVTKQIDSWISKHTTK